MSNTNYLINSCNIYFPNFPIFLKSLPYASAAFHVLMAGNYNEAIPLPEMQIFLNIEFSEIFFALLLPAGLSSRTIDLQPCAFSAFTKADSLRRPTQDAQLGSASKTCRLFFHGNRA